MSVTIWHNPRCSKSRQTLALLNERGIAPEIFLYLETPPSVELIESVLDMLDHGPRELMRKGESQYGELNLGNPELGRDALVTAMAQNPILIERPIVIHGQRAAIGRPPESVLEIF